MKTRKNLIIGILVKLGTLAPGQAGISTAASATTRAVLIKQILQILGILGPGQSAGAPASGTKTRAVVIKQILQNLGILSAGQSAGAPAASTVTRAVLVKEILQNLRILTPGQAAGAPAGTTQTSAVLIKEILQNLGVLTAGQVSGAAAGTTITRAVLIKEILQNLGILTAGQSAGAAAGTTQTQAILIKEILQNLGILSAGQAAGAASGTTQTRQHLADEILQILGIYTAGLGKRTAAAGTITRTELINLILQKLQTYGAGQSPSADDVAAIEAELDGVLEELKTRSVYSGGITATFPDDIYEPLASAAAAIVAAAWGVTKIEGIDVETYRINAERRLTKAEIARSGGDLLVQILINTTIGELNNRGIYSGSGAATTFAEDIFNPIASIVAAATADRLGIDKIAGIDTGTYRKDAEQRLHKVELTRTAGSTMVTERLPSALNELKNRGIYSGGVTPTYADDVVSPLAAAVAALIAEPLGIEKINGIDLLAYRTDAERRLIKVELTRGSGNTLVDERLSGVLEELKIRGVYSGGATSTFPDDIALPLAAAASAIMAAPFGIDKIEGVDLLTYRTDAEKRLLKAELVRGAGSTLVTERLPSVLNELKNRGIYSGGPTSTYADDVVSPLAAVTAAMMAEPFGIEKLSGMDLASYRKDAEQRLIRVELTRGSGNALVDERLPGVLEELKIRGVYSGGATSTFPDDIALPLASAASALLATPFGVDKIDGIDLQTYRSDAERRLLKAELARGSGVTMLEERLDGVLEELKIRGIYSGGITATFHDDIVVPLAAAATPMVATPLGIEKIDGIDLETYRLNAEKRLHRADLARGAGYAMIEERLNGVLEEQKTRGNYLGGVTPAFPDDIVLPLASAAASMLAAPMGIEKIDGMDLATYRLKAEDRLFKSDMARGRGYNLVNDNLDSVLASLGALNIYIGLSFDEFDDAVFSPLIDAAAPHFTAELRVKQIDPAVDNETYRLRAEARMRRTFAVPGQGFVQRAEYF